MQQGGVRFDLLPVQRVIARVHDQKYELEGEVTEPPEQLHELRHEHGVLAAGNADSDPVARADQLIALDGGDKGLPKLLSVLFHNAAFHQLPGFQLFSHVVSSL